MGSRCSVAFRPAYTGLMPTRLVKNTFCFHGPTGRGTAPRPFRHRLPPSVPSGDLQRWRQPARPGARGNRSPLPVLRVPDAVDLARHGNRRGALKRLRKCYAWLWAIIIDLLSYPGFYDIALRDFGLSLGALALARLRKEFA